MSVKGPRKRAAEAALFVSSAEELCGNRNSLVGDLLQILAQDPQVASKEVTARPTPTQKAIWKLLVSGLRRGVQIRR